MLDARMDLGCQCQRRDKSVAPETRRCFEMVSSHLLTQKPPSVPAALMEKAGFLLSPRWQIKSRAVVQLPPRQGSWYPRQHLRKQQQNSHTVGLPPTCRIPVQLTSVHSILLMPGSGARRSSPSGPFYHMIDSRITPSIS